MGKGTRRTSKSTKDQQRRPRGKEVVLRPFSRKIVNELMVERNSRFGEVLSDIIVEWNQLRGVRNAADFRRDAREDLAVAQGTLHTALRSPPGRIRDDAVRDFDAAMQRVVSRLTLITSI